MQRIVGEIFKTQKELHVLMRDKTINAQNARMMLEELETSKNYLSDKQKLSQLQIQDKSLTLQIGKSDNKQ